MALKEKTNKQGHLIVMPGIAFAGNVPHFKAWQTFGQRMLGAKEIQELEKKTRTVPFFSAL